MNNPFLQTIQSRLVYICLWLAVMIVQSSLVGYYFQWDFFNRYCYDAFIVNALQAACILGAGYPLGYYRNVLSIPLFVLFHVLLWLISSAVWLGFGYLLSSLALSGDPLYPPFFREILPVRILFGLMAYIVFVQVYYLSFTSSKLKEKEKAIENLEPVSAPKEKLTRISVKKRQEIYSIPVRQILYIEANGDYVVIHTLESKYLKDRTMKYWETHLPDDTFVRIHRSFIVNIEHISKIELYERETYRIQLKTGAGLKASAAGYKLLKQKMQL
ncbi:MAG: LytTR family transcriptional regulator DNA-binding domain-containing protein [Dysgonamonadaceae bacterium]|jgi:hypothetical protein|nr:LytTR family transcriptional regulator DNA-binding domain-containing protein [Dysgonamonadaceae bacterium]